MEDNIKKNLIKRIINLTRKVQKQRKICVRKKYN